MTTWMYRPYLSILCVPYPVCGSPMWLDCIEAKDKPDHDKRTNECVRCERTRTVVSTDRRNTLSYREKMECDDGTEISSRVYGGREDGDMGSLAAGRVAQSDWAGFW
jgi:hypothetical protein